MGPETLPVFGGHFSSICHRLGRDRSQHVEQNAIPTGHVGASVRLCGQETLGRYIVQDWMETNTGLSQWVRRSQAGGPREHLRSRVVKRRQALEALEYGFKSSLASEPQSAHLYKKSKVSLQELPWDLNVALPHVG